MKLGIELPNHMISITNRTSICGRRSRGPKSRAVFGAWSVCGKALLGCFEMGIGTPCATCDDLFSWEIN